MPLENTKRSEGLGKRRDEWRPFTIVIPAHNEENYLPQTLESLSVAFEAIQFPGEIIVVNDSSTDSTRQVAIDHGTRLIDVELRNIGAVRNAGAKACQTDWLFFLDADTALPGQTLAGALDLLAVGVAGGGAGIEIEPVHKIAAFKWLMFYGIKFIWQFLGGWAAGCFMFCRREVFESFGGFDEEYFAAEELFFSREVAKRGRFQLLREPVLTSARKLEAYTTLELVKFVTFPIMRPRTLFKSRLGLEILYDDEKSR